MKSHSTSHCKKKSRSSNLVTRSYEYSRNLASWSSSINFRTQRECVHQLRRCLSYPTFPWTPVLAPPLQLVCVCLLCDLTETDSTRLPIPAGALPHTDSQSWPGFQGLCPLWIVALGSWEAAVLCTSYDPWVLDTSCLWYSPAVPKAEGYTWSDITSRCGQGLPGVGRPYQTGGFSSVIVAVLMVHLQIAAPLNEEMAI